jgi:hypothetical protein
MNYIKKFNESNNTPKHDITDEFGYWWKGSLIKSIVGKTVEINQTNIDDLIKNYQKQIAPHKPLMNQIYQPVVDDLIQLKNKLGW